MQQIQVYEQTIQKRKSPDFSNDQIAMNKEFKNLLVDMNEIEEEIQDI